ncbi:MAG: hypothetical protein JXA15_11695 [Spirochaetales bacterium]|nr:hypothetical protein [Spirochaetales bacterium]
MEDSSDRRASVLCDGREVPLVPFVEAIVRDTVLGLVGSLKGVDAEAELVVRIGPGAKRSSE